MKRKAIEKIPYLTLPKVVRKRTAKYVGVTALQEIAGEQHLFLEVYRNRGDAKEIPLVRTVLTKKDFGNYFPEADEWTKQKIELDHYYDRGLIWNEPEDRKDFYRTATVKNVLLSKADLGRIRKICTKPIWREERWWEYIYEHENNIVLTKRREAENRKYERRQRALKDRAEHTEPLPEQLILARADRLYFHERHYLYYKKRGCRAQIACSKCGGVTDIRWKSGISYESQFERLTEEPRQGDFGTCPMCGARGEYKCQGKVRGEQERKIHLFLGQKYKEVGMVLRYIQVSKIWKLGLIAGEKGLEMHNASEELSGVENARTYFYPGEKIQTDYHKHSYADGKDFWDDCNLYGNVNINIEAAPVMAETYGQLQGTIFQYSAIREYASQVSEFNPADYFRRYIQTPQLEMLVKMGLTEVVKKLIRCEYGIVNNESAKRLDQFLGIRKEHIRLLIRKHGDIPTLETLQTEKRMNAAWTEEEIEQLTETQLGRGQLEIVLTYMSLRQLLNRVQKYSGCTYGTDCSSAVNMLRNTATTYVDYLTMRQALGYDMTNTVYLQPRNLGEAHTAMITEQNQKEVDKRMTEVAIRFPNIRINYRKLRRQYFWEDEAFLIRPARSAEEIVTEGRLLHHCVGGDNYLRKHNEGESYILFLRQQEAPEIPYITVEIDAKQHRIRQWYGAHDRKPDEQRMQKWLNDYIDRLKSGTLGEEKVELQEAV
mgnify:FL=1